MTEEARHRDNLDARVFRIHTDGGGEFARAPALLSADGHDPVLHTVTTPHSSQQNGKAERAARTLHQGRRPRCLPA